MAVEPDRAKHHDAGAGKSPERKMEEAVRDTFPASDPPAPTGVKGARAVPHAELMGDDAAPPVPAGDTISARFPDRETAKLALEQVVREGPVDRRCVELRPGDDAVTLEVQAPSEQAERIRELLRKGGGEA